MRDSAENLRFDIGSEMVKNLIFLCFSSYPKEHCTSFPALSSTCHRETRKDDGIRSTLVTHRGNDDLSRLVESICGSREERYFSSNNSYHYHTQHKYCL